MHNTFTRYCDKFTHNNPLDWLMRENIFMGKTWLSNKIAYFRARGKVHTVDFNELNIVCDAACYTRTCNKMNADSCDVS